MRLFFWFAVLTLTVSSSHAQTVISDTLYRNYSQIWGTSPTGINQPGETYLQATGWNFNQLSFPSFDPDSGSGLSNGTGVALSLASSGSYTKPTGFSVSIEVNIATPNPVTNTPFAVFGFYSALEPSTNPPTYLDSRANFTGLMLASDGALSLYDSGNLVGGSTVAYAGGTFVPGSFYTLSYSVDTTSGAISGVTLEGSTADYSTLMASATPFSEANTAYVGFGMGVDNDPFKGNARFINLSVEAIPEPGTFGLLVIAAFGLLVALRRRSGSVATF